MNKPKTRIGLLRRELRPCGVTQEKFAKLAGCSKALIQKLEEDPKRTIGERFALQLAEETGVSYGWLLGSYQMRPILGKFRIRYSRVMFEDIQRRKHDPSAINEEAWMCLRYFLINTDRLASVILAAYQDKRPSLALSRLRVALEEIALEFKAAESPAAIGRQIAIKRRNLSSRKLFAQTASGIASRFYRELRKEFRARPARLN